VATRPRRSSSHDRQGGVYKKLVLRDNRIVGAVLYGDTVDGSWYFQLMKDRQDMHDCATT
jgi:nitrite reductase (NADH) large subunit